MIKRSAALGLCLALLFLSSTLHVEGAKTFSLSSSDRARGEGSRFRAVQENSQPITLPQAKGAWLIEISRDGGMRPRKLSVRINSKGEISVASERYAQGRSTIECSLKAKLSAEDLLKLKEAVRAARLSAWRESYDDPGYSICCDQPTTHMTLHLRGAGGAKTSHQTSWYPGSSQLLPADLAELATLGQTLWNKTRERCEDGAR
jgi:hypothetical protein